MEGLSGLGAVITGPVAVRLGMAISLTLSASAWASRRVEPAAGSQQTYCDLVGDW